MTLIQKNDVNQIFAINAPDKDKPASFANYPSGWDTSRSNNGKPTIKQFNYLQQRTDQNVLWIHQNGGALPYDENMEYADGSLVVKNGELVQKSGNGWKPIAGSDSIKAVESITALIAIQSPKNGQVVYVKSYHEGLNRGGRTVIYDSSKSDINDGLFIFKGWVSEPILQLTPDHAGAKPNDASFDNTNILNAVFETKQDIYGRKDDDYHVQGILNSKAQKLLGGWKINTTRYNLGSVDTNVTQPDTSIIKMLYVETAYDLSELLFIKALGFNMINHYGYFSGVPADADGNFWKLLDSAKTAGLKVNLGTENFQAQHNLSEFVQYFQGYDVVFGFSAYDEPGARNLPFATQQARIDTIRANTAKQVSFVDNTGADKPFNQKTNYNIDLLFVDWYSHTQTGTLAERIEKDLQDMRYEFGFFKASSKLSRIIPTVGAFTYDNSLAPGAYYATDINQVIGAAEVFGKVGGGNFAMFPWDAESDPATILKVRNSLELQNLARRLCAQNVRKEYTTDAYIFGHSNFDRDWGVDGLIDTLVVQDKDTTDVTLSKKSYPVELAYGTTNTDRKSPDINPATFYSGIGFKGSDAGLATRIKTHKHVTAYLNYFNVQSLLATEIKLYQTADGGYTHDELFSTSTEGAELEIKVNVKPIAEHGNLMFRVLTPADTSTNYRKFLRGLVVTTDW